MTENTNRTGAADMQAERDRLEAATAARLARDPFATVTPDEAPAEADLASCGHPRNADGECDCASWPERAPVADAAPAPAPAPAADLFKADWPYPVITAADFAALYSTAAEIIKARGYYEYEAQGYADEPGLSITGALKAAALEHAQAADPQDRPEQHYRTAQDLTEELETRLSAVLYVLGQLHSRTGIRDLPDQLTGWTLGHFALGPNPSAAHALALLEQAAAMFRGLADQAAPVTEAPAPTSM
jgi:hypothetical protein